MSLTEISYVYHVRWSTRVDCGCSGEEIASEERPSLHRIAEDPQGEAITSPRVDDADGTTGEETEGGATEEGGVTEEGEAEQAADDEVAAEDAGETEGGDEAEAAPADE